MILRKIVAFFFLLFSMGSLSIIDSSIYGQWDGKAGDKITESLNLLNIAASLLLLWWGTDRLRSVRVNLVFPLAAVSLLLLSVLWSVDPGMTMRRGTAYLFVMIGAVAIVETFDNDTLMRLTSTACALSAVASIALFFTFSQGDQFRGVFAHKNMLGQAMVPGVLASLHGMKRGRQVRSLCAAAVCTTAAFMSRSSTSMLAIGTVVVVRVLGTLYAKEGMPRAVGIFSALALLPVLALVATDPGWMFDLLGKDQTLTGRTNLWPFVIDCIAERPMLGWGYLAFWSPSNPRAGRISDAVGWSVPEAHNGILDFLVQIGVIGTALFVFLFARNMVLAVRCIHGHAKASGITLLAFLIAVALVAVSEAVLLAPDQVFTGQFFITGFMCERQLRWARLGRPNPVGLSGTFSDNPDSSSTSRNAA
jgi:exopolysaccharide production protein ExoQ